MSACGEAPETCGMVGLSLWAADLRSEALHPGFCGSWPQSALMFSPITREGKDHQAYANTKSLQGWQCPPSTKSLGKMRTPKLSL